MRSSDGSIDTHTADGIGITVAYAVFFECNVRLSVPNEFRGILGTFD